MGRLVLAALAIQKNTREVADHFKWLRERQEAQSQAARRAGTTKAWTVGPARSVKNAWGGDKESPTWTQAGLN